MRFTIKREDFLKGLNVASRAIASKNAKAVLENLKLDLDEKAYLSQGQMKTFPLKPKCLIVWAKKWLLETTKKVRC